MAILALAYASRSDSLPRRQHAILFGWIPAFAGMTMWRFFCTVIALRFIRSVVGIVTRSYGSPATGALLARQTTLATYGLNISHDAIRRRLSRGGLNPSLTKATSNRLIRYSNSLDQRTTSFVVDRAKIKLCPLATNRRCDQAICDCPLFCLNVLYALDRRKKLLFRCYRHEITCDDLIAFFAELVAEHAGRHIVVETGLELRGLGDFLKQHREELSVYRPPVRG